MARQRVDAVRDHTHDRRGQLPIVPSVTRSAELTDEERVPRGSTVQVVPLCLTKWGTASVLQEESRILGRQPDQVDPFNRRLLQQQGKDVVPGVVVTAM